MFHFNTRLGVLPVQTHFIRCQVIRLGTQADSHFLSRDTPERGESKQPAGFLGKRHLRKIPALPIGHMQRIADTGI